MRQNVHQNVPWNLEGLDPDTRDAAREAARRAGMSLEEWLNITISDRAARVFADTAQAPARRRAAPPAYDELDAITAKISKVTRGKQAATSSRALENVMSTVSAEADRRARENASKTAEALDSVARWIERAEDRMSESSRAASEGARLAIERQERTANVLGEALGLMTKRLDDIERKVVEGQQPSVAAALKAVEKVEQHLAKLGDAQGGRGREQVDTALRGFEERIAAITEKLAQTGSRAIGRRGLSINEELKGAVAEIRSRQAMLDGESATQRTHNDILNALRGDIGRLAAQLDTVRKDDGRDSRIVAELRQELEGLQEKVTGLATREEISALEKTLGELTREAVKAADAGRDKELEALTKLIGRVEGELGALSERIAGGVQEHIASDYRRLSEKIDSMAESGVDPKAIKTMMRELEAIRVVFSELADPDRVQDLSEQVRELSRQVGQMARSQVDAIEFATLRSAVDDIRSAVKASRESQANADQMIDQFAQLTRKLDELPERIPQADLQTLSNQYESVAEQLATLAARQPRDQIARLSEQVEGMAAKLEDMSGRLTRTQAADMASEIVAMSADLSHLPGRAPAVDTEAINRQFEALSAKIDDLVARPPVADLGPVSRQIEALEKRLEEGLGGRGERAAPTEAILGRLDALTTKLDRLESGPQHDFEDAFRQLQSNLEASLVNARGAASPGIETLIERLDQLDAKIREPQARDDLKPLEDMLSQLAAKLDAAERPNAEIEAVDALEGQIAEIMKRLERSDGGDPALTSLERSMSDLMAQIEVMRDGAVEAAERAAKTAIADTLGTLPKDEARATEELDFLTRSLIDLKASQNAAERRSLDTLGSVQDTLDKLVERLALLEERGRGENTGNRNQSKAGKSSGSSSATAGRPATPPGSSEVQVSFDRRIARSLGDAAKAQAAEAADRSLLNEADAPLGAAGSLGGDVLLEPGSGRPRPTQPRLDDADLGDAADIKASFIAAARRAAQSAAAEAAATARKSDIPPPREPLSRHASDPSGLAGRMRQMMAGKRRPLLMGVAAILLAIGAFQVGTRYLAERDANSIAEVAVEKSSRVADAQQPLPEATPRLEAPSSPGTGSGGPDPATTASIDFDALLPQEETSQVVIGAEDLVGDQPESAADGAVLPPRREDAQAPEPIEYVAPRQLFPSMVSADEIPASAAPDKLREAVLAGDVVAVYELATRAADGRGMMRDPKLAAKLFERAAAHGFVPAQYRIGNHYEKGLGVTRDFSLATLWYQRAAESGNARAMHNLAVLLAEGVSGKPDYEAAVNWFRRAAEHGVRDSQYNLAVLLARGLGTPQDLVGSYSWFAIAAEQGDDDAGAKRDEVAGRLDAQELSLAKATVESWRPQPPKPEANEVVLPTHGWSDGAERQAALDTRG